MTLFIRIENVTFSIINVEEFLENLCNYSYNVEFKFTIERTEWGLRGFQNAY